MKILVTSGAGFIGSNVVDAYIDAGHEVVVIDDLSTGKEENLNPEAKFIKADIRSDEIGEIFKAEKPDVLNHHAAQMSVPASVEDPAFDANVNILGLINLLEAARGSGTKKVILISTGGAVYGEVPEYPTTESCVPRPLSPYAITKFASEKYLDFYNNQYGLDYTVLRYANVYGPRQIPHGEAGVVAIFMENLLSAKASALYHFPEEPRGMTRDYCYVGDIARANLAAIVKGSAEVLNIGTGIATHTLDLYEGIFEAVNERLPSLEKSLKVPTTGAARPGDIKRSCLKADRAAEKLGWQPQISLEQGIRNTLDWMMDVV